MRYPAVRKCCCLYTMYHINNNAFSCVLKLMMVCHHHQFYSEEMTTINYTVQSCPLTKLVDNSLHSADDDAVIRLRDVLILLTKYEMNNESFSEAE